ncbi:MAG: endo-1,4-beta-xylanase [Phycisphaeraceae bacterium]
MEPMLAPEGEEWKNVAEADLDHFGNTLRPREEVLAEARQGIENHRKSDAQWRLVDGNGEPMPGLKLEIEQVTHAFEFGCSSGSTLAEEAEDPRIKARNALFVKLFNCTTAKCYWDEKWHQPIEQHQGQRITQRFTDEIDWARAYGLKVRGHPLVWTVPKAIPQWVRRYPYEKQLALMEHNCRSLIQAAEGRIKLWDLANEMLWEPSLRHLAQRDWPHLESTDEMLTYLEPAVHWARDEDPDAVYVLNDYGLEVTYTPLKDVTAAMQRRRFVELVDAMQQRGCAPDAVGTQSHVGKWFPMDVVRKTLDELGQPGLPLQVSEYWAKPNDCPNASELDDEQRQAALVQYLGDFYTVVFGHPQVTHLTYWGGAEFFDRGGWVPSPMYHALDALINDAWRTRTQTTTDREGVLRFRGFHGNYVLRWTDPTGRPRSRRMELHRDVGNDTIVTLAY